MNLFSFIYPTGEAFAGPHQVERRISSEDFAAVHSAKTGIWINTDPGETNSSQRYGRIIILLKTITACYLLC